MKIIDIHNGLPLPVGDKEVNLVGANCQERDKVVVKLSGKHQIGLVVDCPHHIRV
jgi:hypothetical protein